MATHEVTAIPASHVLQEDEKMVETNQSTGSLFSLGRGVFITIVRLHQAQDPERRLSMEEEPSILELTAARSMKLTVIRMKIQVEDPKDSKKSKV